MHPFILLLLSTVYPLPMTATPPALYPTLQTYCATLPGEFGQIPADRRQNLANLARYLTDQRAAGKMARLTFICTHNSRRSQFGQAWAAVAASYYGWKPGQLEVFSGGTEATAFNPRAVAALARAGCQLTDDHAPDNPRYQLRFGPDQPALLMFSKKYNDSFNPQADFCAVLVCSQADESCPVVLGATKRIYHGYEDPKSADGQPNETATYDASCRLIAREIFYLFSLTNQ